MFFYQVEAVTRTFPGARVRKTCWVNSVHCSQLSDGRTCINPLPRLRLVWGFFFEPSLILIMICSFL